MSLHVAGFSTRV